MASQRTVEDQRNFNTVGGSPECSWTVRHVSKLWMFSSGAEGA